MADFNALETLINAYIKKNGVQAITGNILNGVLRGMVSALGKGYTIIGVATPSTDPGTMTGPCAYYASQAGTYTNFGGLVVNDGDVAMLIYDEQTWHKDVMFSLAAEASVDANVGTPWVNASFENGMLTFTFGNMKGNPGDAAGFGTVNATVDSNIGTPGVSVQTSGPDTAKNMTFQFTNLKGETGVTSVVATVDNTTGTPACAVSLNGQELHLDFTGLKGAQGNTGVSADYPITIVNNLTDGGAASALSAEMGKQLEAEVSQLELEVSGNLMSARAKNALMAVFQKVAFTVPDVSAEMDELENALFSLDEVVGIEAVYTQSGVVYDQGVNTLDDLRADLIVRAEYGDGTKVEISNYTLSGQLTQGTSVILVEYLGFSATFNVQVTHYSTQMVFSIANGDIASYKGSPGKYDNNTKYCVSNFGSSTNRRCMLASSGDAPMKNSSGTSIGYYPIPVPRNASKVTLSVSPTASNVGILVCSLSNGNYVVKSGDIYDGYFASPYERVFTAQFKDLIRKGGYYLMATAGLTSGSYAAATEPSVYTITFE